MGRMGSLRFAVGFGADPLMGPLQTKEYQSVLAWSDVHLYFTVPFVLSWSLIEAMAARCCIVGSATPPVEELLQEGYSARLVDFFDSSAQASVIGELLDNPDQRHRLAAAAAQKHRLTPLQRGSSIGFGSLSSDLWVNGDQSAQPSGIVLSDAV